MPMVTIVTGADFASEVLQSSVPTLVDVWAAWCAPCKMLEPEVAKVAEQTEGRVKVAKLDVAQDAALAAQYGVTSIPALLLFVNGEIVERLAGYMPAARIMDKLERHLG